ncbi:MAG: alpha/beta fold hydrolase [Spirochaetales bacterium]
MARAVYKSEKGRSLVEDYYRRALDSYTGVSLRRRLIATPFGETHFLECGDKTKQALILLHGSMSNSASWFGMLPALAPSFSLYCADIPGEPGLSAPVRMPLASGQPAAWLASIMDSLGLGQAAFLGMSLGSFYALRLAATNPERVGALSMITTGGIAPQRVSFLFKALLYMALGARGQTLLNKAVYHKTSVPPEVLDFQALVSANFNPMAEPLPILSDAEMRKLSMPLQYFGGDHDALLDTEKTAARLAALVPHADIQVLADTGHVIIDQTAKIHAFLLRACAPPSADAIFPYGPPHAKERL